MRRTTQCLLLAVILTAIAFGQLDRGTLTGSVSDPSGAAIPGVQVTVRSTATNATYQTTANVTGQYAIPNLPAGIYSVSFEVGGFKRAVRDGVRLAVNETLRLDMGLELGQVTEAIEVSAEMARLQTETPEVGTALSNKQIIDLPLSFGEARSAEDFAYKLAPGAVGGSWKGYTNGSTAFSKETLLDGAPVATNISGNFMFSNPSVEALQEFKVQTSGLSAEFGRTQGGVFNYVMKSGTNRVHGSAYGAMRNEALNANTFANNFRGERRAADRRVNAAGSMGGPVFIPKVYDGRNRTFFYTAFEYYRNREMGFGAPNRTVPLPEFYQGDFSRLLGPNTGQTDALGRPVARGAIYDPTSFRLVDGRRWVGDIFPGNRIPVTRFSQVSRRLNDISQKSYLPTVRDASGQIPLVNNSYFPSAAIPEFDQYQWSLKGDQIINNSHKISASYNLTVRPRLLLDKGGMWDTNDAEGGPLSAARRARQKASLGRLSYDWTVSPRVLNHLTAFFNRLINPVWTVHTDVDGAKELGIKGLATTGYPIVNWGGGPFVTLANPGETQDNVVAHNGWGFIDTVSFSRGRHFMRTGFDFRRNHLNTRPVLNSAFNFAARGTAIPGEAFSGNQTGYAFASYLLGIVDNASLADLASTGGRRHYYAMFFQDDFKIGSKLTLNLGLRWEYQPPAMEAADRISTWDPEKTDPVSGLKGAYAFAGTCQGCTGKRYFGRRSLRDWGPRIGFAWRAAEKWTVRGAYGIVYSSDLFNTYTDATPLGKLTNTQVGGTYQLAADAVQPWAGIFNWDAGFPQNRFEPPSMDPSWGNRNRPGAIDPEYGRTPYIQSWNFNIQRELPGGLVLDLGYVGNKATGIYTDQTALWNQLPVSALAQYGRNLNNQIRNAADAAANGVRYPYPGFTGTVAGALRPYPQVQGVQTVRVSGAPLGFSHFHALEVTVNRQFRKGLTAYGSYVWSKTMANVESSLVGDNPGRPIDYYNLGLEKSISDHDVPHMVKAFVDYDLPMGRGKGRVANVFLGGWSVSAIVNYYSGQPLGFGGSMPLAGGWNGAVNRANVAAGDLKSAAYDRTRFELSSTSSAVNTYLDKSKFADPAPLTLGTGAFRYAQIRGFGTINEDLGLRKNTVLSEGVRLQLRFDLFNAFNRHQLGGINTGVVNPLFGQVTQVSGNRVAQAGARVDF